MNNPSLMNALTEGFIHAYRDPLWKNIPLDDGMKNIIMTKQMQKLDRIRQNGPTCHIYPGAVHTRLSHSLGVYRIGRELLLGLLTRQVCPFTVKGERSFLAACLLHDIGHFPYAHSLKEIKIREHEEIAAEQILNDKELSEAIDNAGADKEMVASIIDKTRDADSETEIYRNFLSGALDPDKLDYLNRDAFFAGVPYGIQDNDHILSSVILHDGRLALPYSNYQSLENILFSKYLMYKNVYWHKGTRSATAMIKKALLSALREGVLKKEELIMLDDFQFQGLEDREYPPFSLIRDVANSRLFKASYTKQWEKDGELEKAAGNIENRFEAEDKIYMHLKKDYPQLERHEVIIDIPEPISFEADVSIIMEDGSTKAFCEVSGLFSKDIGKQFATSLRVVSVFTPAYVSKEKVERVVENVF
ncbi:MAG: HD domain-containing protein [Sphaerochaetaceae bacterium]|nr:HD domain-containing protein [Sphaerochaetaceae bacterium]